MVDVAAIRAFMRDLMVPFGPGKIWPHPDGGHAERVRHFEIARNILEHGRAGRLNPARLDKAFISAPSRLRFVGRGHDIEYPVEDMVAPELPVSYNHLTLPTDSPV